MMTSTSAAPSRVIISLQFLGMALVWGSSFFFIKIALGGVSFSQVVWTRLVLGGLTLGIIVLITRQRLPREGVVWLHFTVVALLNCVIPHLAFSWAEQYVSSGLASIYNAVTPIMTVILATLAFRVEKLGGSKVFGVVLGILGVIVIIGPWKGMLGGDLFGQLACLVAALSYGVSYGYVRKFLSHRPIPGATFAFANIGIAGAIMLVLTPLVAWQPVRLDPAIVAGLLALGVLGTGFAYIWNINVLRAWGPTTASTVTYLIPVVGVLLGVLVLGERLSWNEPLGALLVLAGILFTQRRIRFARRGLAASQ